MSVQISLLRHWQIIVCHCIVLHFYLWNCLGCRFTLPTSSPGWFFGLNGVEPFFGSMAPISDVKIYCTVEDKSRTVPSHILEVTEGSGNVVISYLHLWSMVYNRITCSCNRSILGCTKMTNEVWTGYSLNLTKFIRNYYVLLVSDLGNKEFTNGYSVDRI